MYDLIAFCLFVFLDGLHRHYSKLKTKYQVRHQFKNKRSFILTYAFINIVNKLKLKKMNYTIINKIPKKSRLKTYLFFIGFLACEALVIGLFYIMAIMVGIADLDNLIISLK